MTDFSKGGHTLDDSFVQRWT